MLKNVTREEFNACSKISAIFSTLGVMTKKLYSPELQCNCSSDIEKLQSDVRHIKIQVDELFYIVRSQPQPRTVTTQLEQNVSSSEPDMSGCNTV